jgi:hypothetical protein
MSSWPVGAAPKKPSRHRRYTAAKALATEHPTPPWHGPPPAESTARATAVEISLRWWKRENMLIDLDEYEERKYRRRC